MLPVALPVAVLALELGLMYLLGSYAMGTLGSAGAVAGSPRTGRLLFYVLVAPGVVAHESAHYLACKLTGTPVGRFVPFLPSRDASGGVTLGYVEHGSRNALTSAIIGLAPVVLNPLALVFLTLIVTPLDPLASAPSSFASGGAGTVDMASGMFGGVLSDIVEQLPPFFSESPVLAVVWAYLVLSLCLGAVPSRSDLVAVPGAFLLVLVGGFIYSSFAGTGFLSSVASAASGASTLYMFPLLVAAVAAVAGALLVHRY